MAGIEIPQVLLERLDGSEFGAPTRGLADAVGLVLEDNAMPFFPAFTNHGVPHVNGVLETVVRLVPENVLDSDALSAKDAAVISCAGLLHDLAMHIGEQGFLSLVGENTDFRPRPWFSEMQIGREADLEWPQLWRKFQLEARHFGPGQASLILGPGGQIPPVAHEKELDPTNWSTGDRLLIGEFLRRHHARLSHEIAVYGFPGLDAEVFPVLGGTLPLLADISGAVARSHGESLRLMLDYLNYLAPGSKRQKGTLALYHMALLRVADYLQIGSDRAPVLLLRLKSPQSPLSVEEWEKGGAVSSIDWENDDPYAVYVTVNVGHGLRTHLALKALLADLQHEFDTTSAVLDEEFGSGGLASLSLAKRRVLTNLDEKSVHDQLPYAPVPAAPRSDPDLFRLVIKDLYGNQPAVAGRELVQNAVDAVRARRSLERTSTVVPHCGQRDFQADVLVTLEAQPEGLWTLRVADKGIGMTPEVVVDYYLQAGASFGLTPDELEKLGDKDALQIMKAGRFGVGAFAAFLLGPEVKVVTRHVEAARGLRFAAHLNGDLVELAWDDDVPFGTVVEIQFDAGVLPVSRWGDDERHTPKRLLRDVAGFYRLGDPRVSYVYRGPDETEEIDAPADIPIPHGRLPDAWRKMRTPKGYDGVLWRVPSERRRFLSRYGGQVTHNGIAIERLSDRLILEEGSYRWSSKALRGLLARPSVAVFDPRQQLPIALHRYGLVDPTLPFEDSLLESIGRDFVAHALATVAVNHPLQRDFDFSGVFSSRQWMPALPSLLSTYLRNGLLVLWEISDPMGAELRSRSPTVQQLLKSRSAISWRDFPHRSGFELNEVDNGSLYYEEHLEWGHALDLVEDSASSWAERLGCEVFATAVVRGDARPSEVDASPRERFQEPFGWRDIGIGSGLPGSGIFLEGDSAHMPLVEDKLVRAACSVRDSGAYDSVAMTVFGNFDGGDPREARLASPWTRYVEGGLDRGPRRRTKSVEEILGKHPSLRSAVAKWERLLAQAKNS
jgi:molecular chaperone HtpG